MPTHKSIHQAYINQNNSILEAAANIALGNAEKLIKATKIGNSIEPLKKHITTYNSLISKPYSEEEPDKHGIKPTILNIANC